jgi:hypothetical protein
MAVALVEGAACYFPEGEEDHLGEVETGEMESEGRILGIDADWGWGAVEAGNAAALAGPSADVDRLLAHRDRIDGGFERS